MNTFWAYIWSACMTFSVEWKWIKIIPWTVLKTEIVSGMNENFYQARMSVVYKFLLHTRLIMFNSGNSIDLYRTCQGYNTPWGGDWITLWQLSLGVFSVQSQFDTSSLETKTLQTVLLNIITSWQLYIDFLILNKEVNFL